MIAFIACVAIPLAVGSITGMITAEDTQNWYSTLNKPSFNPPNSIFAPIWTTLYILMGISLFMIWKSPDSWERRRSMLVFFVQLFFNFWWSILFFSFHLVFFAIIDITILWLLILYMMASFKQVRPAAAYLNIPYLLWVSFAAILNISIWSLN